jgi:hypothetical protein
MANYSWINLPGEDRELIVDHPSKSYWRKGTLMPAYQHEVTHPGEEGRVLLLSESLAEGQGRISVVQPIARIRDRETGEIIWDPRSDDALQWMSPLLKQWMNAHPEWPPDGEWPEAI